MENDKNVLSQDEVGNLFDDVEEIDATDVVNNIKEINAKPYDLVSQDRIVLSRMPTLEVINGKFVRYGRTRIFEFMRAATDIDFNGVQVIKYSDYMSQLSSATCINTIRANPLKGNAAIIIDSDLILRMVDRFFGGIGRHVEVKERDFTTAEHRFIQRILDEIFKALSDAWASIVEFSFEFDSTETNASMANKIAPDEVMVVSSFNVRIESFSGEIGVAFPYAMLEPVKEFLIYGRKASEEKDDRWQSAFTEGMSESRLTMNLKIAEKEMILKNVLTLTEGDIIPIQLKKELTMTASGVPLYRGKLGTENGSLAFRISEVINIEDDQ
jgi:flagellar motor switch protein FliM